MELYNIKVMLKRANCWTFTVIREILTCWFLLKKFVATLNLLFFHDLLITFVSGTTDHHY